MASIQEIRLGRALRQARVLRPGAQEAQDTAQGVREIGRTPERGQETDLPDAERHTDRRVSVWPPETP
jgi:hypothetical protein